MGRDTTYTKELGEKICERLSTSSDGLRKICKELGLQQGTVYRWLEKNEDFREQYTRARENQADFMADEMVEIADDGKNDLMTIGKEGAEYEVENKEVTNRSKLRIETRKWLAMKLKAKKYGDKVDHTVNGEMKLTIDVGYGKDEE